MDFPECLKYYMQELDCSSKSLAKAAGLSEATLSRYRRGERIPDADGEQMKLLSGGLARLAMEKGRTDLTEEILSKSFREVMTRRDDVESMLPEKFDMLIAALKINVSLMAKAMNFDPSFLSRVKIGQRRPADIDDFSVKVAEYIVKNFKRETDKLILAGLLGCSAKLLKDPDSEIRLISGWLKDNTDKKQDTTGHFLKHLDEFDLNEYIEVIHFNDIKIPNVPIQLIGSKTYYGLEEMRRAELDFLKSTVLSKSTEPVFMYSNMDMKEMAEDPDFTKKFMFGLAALLKKGLDIHIIHHLDRPFRELMLGLEGWIPLYMTGLVKPYYMAENQTSVYQNLTYVSGQAALAGECLRGHHNAGKYELYKSRQAVQYYREKAELTLSFASRLMLIYKSSQKREYESFVKGSELVSKLTRNIISSLPIYTMHEQLLKRILDRNGIAKELQEQILAYRAYLLEHVESVVRSGDWYDELTDLAEDISSVNPYRLNLTHFLAETEITYTAEEYRLHYAQHKEFDKAHKGYHCTYQGGLGFKNIDICIDKGNMVIISKRNLPVINFVISHPTLVNAISNYKAPVSGDNKTS